MNIREAIVTLFYRIATGRKRTRTLLTPAGGIFFFIIIGGLVYATVKIEKWLGFSPSISKPWNWIIAGPFLVVGLALVIWSIAYFVMAKGTPVPFNPPQRLVTTGPYAHARNPMLTGGFLVLFGLGFLLQSILVVIVMTPLVILLNVIELKTIEEAELLKRFGQDYERYRQSVPMFFRGFKRRL